MVWTEPTYTDNCGVYPDCKVDKTTDVHNGEEFKVNVPPVPVLYTAIDPSGNKNDDCTFSVKLVCK